MPNQPLKVEPKHVRYIKLGRAGGHEQFCIDHSLCYLGFGTGEKDIFDQAIKASECRDDDSEWDRLRDLLYQRDTERDEQARKSQATLACNQIRSFYSAGPETLWITFYNGKLYFAFLDSDEKPKASPEHRGSFRSVKGSWRCTDANGSELLVDKLSGQITKTQLFRGTSCEISDGPKGYLLRRINCEQHGYILAIDKARLELEKGLEDAIKSLTPQDFEQLVDLIFSRTLRRVSVVGKVQKFVDIVYENPLSPAGITENTCVQVKSRTSKAEFLEYLNDPQRMTYSNFYYVFHESSDLEEDYEIPQQYTGSVKIIGSKTLANLVVETGLISWLTNKAG